MARYRKLYPRFWKDERIRLLGPMEKLIASYCLTGQSNRIGLFSFSPGMAAEDTGINPGTFLERFGKVCQTLRWAFDEASSILYIPTWWKWNEPEGPNQLIGCLTDLKDLPETPLKSLFFNNVESLPLNLRGTFTQTLAERYPKPLAIQEQEQEQEKNTLSAPPTSRASDNGFETLWALHPGPKGPKAEALKAFRQAKPPKEVAEAMMAQIAYKADCDRRGAFCAQLPHLHRWLKKRRWEDEIPEAPPGSYDDLPEGRTCSACGGVHEWLKGQRLEPCPQEPT